MNRTAIVIFAKAPLPGWAKTRLVPALGADGAAALAERMLAHAARAGAGAGMDMLEICAAPDASHRSFTQLAQAHGLSLTAQGDGDLGQRMHRAFGRVLATHDQALIIGTDAPALDSGVLVHAASLLAQHDAVFVPAMDGGYALVGLRSPQAALFEEMPWSTPQVMALTRERLRAAGLRWAELPAVADIDEPADLFHLPVEWLA
jgi:rSAM/selenodomain-associated transferase 1